MLRLPAIVAGVVPYWFGEIMFELVTPAKAGVQARNLCVYWIPGSALPSVAFAGMTVSSYFLSPDQ